jgi:hypothetical protein
MAKKKKRRRVSLEGLVSSVSDDSLAEISIMTEDGQEILVHPASPIGSPFDWLDQTVRVQGELVRNEGRKYLWIYRIQSDDYEWDRNLAMDDEFELEGDWSGWRHGEEDHEDHF